jgi:hypothetical protein
MEEGMRSGCWTDTALDRLASIAVPVCRLDCQSVDCRRAGSCVAKRHGVSTALALLSESNRSFSQCVGAVYMCLTYKVSILRLANCDGIVPLSWFWYSLLLIDVTAIVSRACQLASLDWRAVIVSDIQVHKVGQVADARWDTARQLVLVQLSAKLVKRCSISTLDTNNVHGLHGTYRYCKFGRVPRL